MEDAHRDRVHHLIGIAERETRDGRAGLADSLHRWCWPNGGADRTDPAGRGRIHRLGPELLDELDVDCTCADGRCTLCN
jgi:hypothetical protein